MPIYSNFKFLLHKLGCGVIKEVLFYNGFLGFYTLSIVDLLRKVVLLMIYRTGLTRVVIINVHVQSEDPELNPSKSTICLSCIFASQMCTIRSNLLLNPQRKGADRKP